MISDEQLEVLESELTGSFKVRTTIHSFNFITHFFSSIIIIIIIIILSTFVLSFISTFISVKRSFYIMFKFSVDNFQS